MCEKLHNDNINVHIHAIMLGRSYPDSAFNDLQTFSCHSILADLHKQRQPKASHPFPQKPSEQQEKGASVASEMFKGVGKGSPSRSSPNRGSPIKQAK
ncbi:hypothetical protein JD844_011623 [Phrynosoma platyrhinos]|uniref:Uncharacterized protein n=1 Tax=Phrynosoma platyrhinos TaxID=52577 RepID=A0ABQ7TIS1_PHRPL|nr:hypothetical protein JD844_011623 [Phrynosoma platyrhinos]